MWYVMQVRGGSEENIILQCNAYIEKDILEDCFLPKYEEKRKIQGRWQIQKKLLFPGYLFLITDNVTDLFHSLKRVNGLTKLLGNEEEIIALQEEEVRFLQKFCGEGEERIAGMSEGMIEGNEVIILSGPLMGMEAHIKKIDRHKRKAWVEIEMFGRKQRVEVGLEIPVKRMGRG